MSGFAEGFEFAGFDMSETGGTAAASAAVVTEAVLSETLRTVCALSDAAVRTLAGLSDAAVTVCSVSAAARTVATLASAQATGA